LDYTTHPEIIIFTRIEEGHDEIVQEVLCRLCANDLFLKPEKCFFKQQEIEFLGLIIGPNGVEMDPSKVEGIMNWPMPTKVKDVQSLLGLANFYHQFVKDFSKIAAPLHKLTRKDQKWEWDAVHQKAMDELKARFMKQPILTMVDTMKELYIKSDASDFATGAVLSMKCDDNKWHPCAYLSKGLNDVEQNYDTHDKDMFRIMRALESWRYYLEGAKVQFEIWNNHRNLQ